MSKKQNKQKGKRDYDKHMEEHLFKTMFPLECESIPLEELTLEEQDIIQRCIRIEPLNTEEKATVKKILNNYRAAIKKYNPRETLNNVDNAITIIESEQELLDILDDPERKHLLVHLPVDGKLYELDFEVLPISDSRAVTSIQMQMDIFKDYTKEEIDIYTKAQDNKRLTPQEQRIVDKISAEITEKASEQQDELIITLLANQLKLRKSSMDLEKRKEFWTKFPFNAKMSVWIQIRNRLGLTEESNERLFPTR